MAYGFSPEILIGSYGFAVQVCAAWLGAHSKDYDLENEISVRHYIVLFIFPIAYGYYFYANFSKKDAAIKFSQSLFVFFILVFYAELLNILINGHGVGLNLSIYKK